MLGQNLLGPKWTLYLHIESTYSHYCIVTTFNLIPDPVCYGDSVTVTCNTTAGYLVEWKYTSAVDDTSKFAYNPVKLITLPIIVGQLMITNVTNGSSVVSSIATIQRIQQDAAIVCTDDVSLTSWSITVEGITLVNIVHV